MSKDELLIRRAKSMARSLEVEGADYKRMEKIILQGLRNKQK